MAITIQATKAKAGRSYKVNGNGPADVSQKYQVVLDAPLAIDDLPVSFTGIPAIGSEHPNRKGYYALEYEVTQPEGAAKATLDVTVKYGPADITTVHIEGEPDQVTSVTEWGWDDGTGEKELVSTVEANPKPVVNSAGDPFESVPTYTIPTPTFTKVIRTSTRQAYAQYLCTVNDAQVVIGGMTCPARTLLCSVAERKLIGEAKLPYEYTVHLKYRSNVVPQGGNDVEIGWDVAIVDAGMREIDSTTGELKLITVQLANSDEEATVTSPELLDGHGHAIVRSQGGSNDPILLVFQAYKRTSFPAWCYSEPPTPGTITPSQQNASQNASQGGGD